MAIRCCPTLLVLSALLTVTGASAAGMPVPSHQVRALALVGVNWPTLQLAVATSPKAPFNAAAAKPKPQVKKKFNRAAKPEPAVKEVFNKAAEPKQRPKDAFNEAAKPPEKPPEPPPGKGGGGGKKGGSGDPPPTTQPTPPARPVFKPPSI